jgi:hypothetical protein
MELKDFIAKTISQVMGGVVEAQKLAEEAGGAVNPRGQLYLSPDSAPFMDKETTRIGDFINFDVEVEVTEEKEESGGAKISIASIGGFGGKLFRKRQNRSTNRVSFRLPVIYPKGTYAEKEKIAYLWHSELSPLKFSSSNSSACTVGATLDINTKPSKISGEED